MNQNSYYKNENNILYTEQRINIYNIIKENQSLKKEIIQLKEQNNILENKLSEYEQTSKVVLNDTEFQISQLKSEISRYELEKENTDKYIHNLIIKAQSDNEEISQYKNKIETLKNEIIKLNSNINIYQNKEIEYSAKLQKAYENNENIKSVNKSLIKENNKLKKNLNLFANENHCAAIKIKELESENNNEELNIIIAGLLEKINNITLLIKNKTN